MAKAGITINIPGFGRREIRTLLTDYTGTLARGGRIDAGVRERLVRLAERIDIHVVTADTFDCARRELEGIALNCHRLEGAETGHDTRKREYGEKLGLRDCAVFGNGNNDRLVLKAAKESGGLAIAVDNGEGCAMDALVNAHLFITGAANAIDLLLEPKGCKATLRF